jgi:Protein of unknown function (DUF4232)
MTIRPSDMKRTTIMLLLAASTIFLTACDPAETEVGTGNPTSGAASSPAESTAGSTSASEQPPEAGDVNPPPCLPENVEAVIEEGDSGAADYTLAPISLTNNDTDACEVAGNSTIEFMTGPEGRPVGIDVVFTNEEADEVVVLQPGERAWMVVSYPSTDGGGPGCSDSSTFALVDLPGDTGSVEAGYADPELLLPPVCGQVEVEPWEAAPTPN